MTCLEKLREMHPEWSDNQIADAWMDKCPWDYGIMKNSNYCSSSFSLTRCEMCWDRKVPETTIDPVIDAFAAAVERVEADTVKTDDSNVKPNIPWEFEYVSKYVIENEKGEPEERSERVWVHILESWEKQRYTRKPCYRIRFEQECGIMWEGWCTEADVLEMLEKRV